MAPARTRTLVVSLSVTGISSSKQLTLIFMCGYKMLLYHLVVRFQKILTIGHSCHGLQSWDFWFFMHFFSPSPKKNFLKRIILKIFHEFFYLFFMNFFTYFSRIFLKIFHDFFLGIFMNFLKRFKTYVKKKQRTRRPLIFDGNHPIRLLK